MKIKDKFILSGRYELLQLLGEGSDGTVYLARHRSLELERAVKVFPKKNDTPPLFAVSEANVLKTIRHPGIPTIYDLEEDQNNYYLVEEYIRGESLSQFLLHQKSISLNLFLQFCEQLCDIFEYLHTLIPNPILYQDLKPEHIIVSGTQLKLIDFSVSAFLADSGDDIQHFGNTAFSAPELSGTGPLTRASDIYSIGRIMQYMADYVDTAVSRNILTIIQKATSAAPEHRYETVGALASAIQQVHDNNGRMHLRQTIAVLGSYPGCGATHIAIALTAQLNALGHRTVYFEENYSDSLRKSVPHLRGAYEREGCYIYRSFQGYPRYGAGIGLKLRTADISILDYGCDVPDSLAAADRILLVCGGAPWHRDSLALPGLPSEVLQKRLKIVANLCGRDSAIYFAKRYNAPVYLYPFDPDPFEAGGGKQKFAEWLSYRKGGIGRFLCVRNLASRFRE